MAVVVELALSPPPCFPVSVGFAVESAVEVELFVDVSAVELLCPLLESCVTFFPPFSCFTLVAFFSTPPAPALAPSPPDPPFPCSLSVNSDLDSTPPPNSIPLTSNTPAARDGRFCSTEALTPPIKRADKRTRTIERTRVEVAARERVEDLPLVVGYSMS